MIRYTQLILARLGICLAATLLTACATSPLTRFYTLGVVAVAPVAPPLSGRSIVVGSVELPAYLDRPQMAVRGEQGEIAFREFERWAEPLETSFPRVFAENLAVAGGTQQVVAIPIPQQLATDFRIMARVSRFDVDRAGQAVLVVQWFASDGDNTAIILPRQDTFSREVPLPLRPETSAAALSGTIADFAALVARILAEVDQ
jgi:hypothetical protein